ncbi:acetyltransferase, including N-acetylases of ribosomal protein [Lysobacter enzymogenes]|uniref:Acetyltransferase, including N-acetylases of ribosomal protein n=1 Tax=Lysobacter enzymogenes TaxID=69 RepID=A0A0S2DA64_LYSEN|nr:GNAT family N-acetyltransferase [Lysobacter enzymogenes]ALN55446.1 acetyltransferase, including N-acetylases of ribosomal protein [Lysobacter enzymogenes]QCW24525.1 GNAT family N-acetyltransferase [Lysobacter enzymogenes]
MPTIHTDRLTLRELAAGDAGFILELLNEPGFLGGIGDRGVRDLDGALRYIHDGPAASYARHGFGLWRVELREGGEPIGLCGLLRRDTLPDPDLGYAFLQRHWQRGYAVEAGEAVLRYAGATLALPRVLAIVNPDNASSIKVLERLGMRAQGTIRHGTENRDVRLYATAEVDAGADAAPA